MDLSTSCCVFPANGTVQKANGKQVQMGELCVDDEVMVVDQNNAVRYSPVVAFAHQNRTATANYLKITARGSQNNIDCSLSAHHFIRVMKCEGAWAYVRAKKVEVGDRVLVDEAWGAGDHGNKQFATAVVESIEEHTAIGAFCPLTPTGTIVVDGMAASCYAVGPSHEVAHRTIQACPKKLQRWLFGGYGKAEKAALALGRTGKLDHPVARLTMSTALIGNPAGNLFLHQVLLHPRLRCRPKARGLLSVSRSLSPARTRSSGSATSAAPFGHNQELMCPDLSM